MLAQANILKLDKLQTFAVKTLAVGKLGKQTNHFKTLVRFVRIFISLIANVAKLKMFFWFFHIKNIVLNFILRTWVYVI